MLYKEHKEEIKLEKAVVYMRPQNYKTSAWPFNNVNVKESLLIRDTKDENKRPQLVYAKT